MIISIKLSDLTKMISNIISARYRYKTVIEICNHPELSDEKVKAIME